MSALTGRKPCRFSAHTGVTAPPWTSAEVSAVHGVPSYAPCPCQGICITYSLLLALPRRHLRVGGVFSWQHQQLILAHGPLLIVPFAFNHYTYLIGADFPIDRTYVRNPYGCLPNGIKVTYSEHPRSQSSLRYFAVQSTRCQSLTRRGGSRGCSMLLSRFD